MYGAKTKYNPSGFSWPLKMGPIGCPETSVRNYHYSLRNNSEERISNPWHSEVSKTFTQLESLVRSLTHIESFIQTGQHKHGKTRIWFDAVGGTVSVTMPAVEKPDNSTISWPTCPPSSTPRNYLSFPFARKTIYIWCLCDSAPVNEII